MKAIVTILSLIFTMTHAWANVAITPKRWINKNGAEVIFYKADGIPMLDISVAFKAGSAYDDEAFGLSVLTSQLLNQGNGGLSASHIAEELAETGAQYDANNSRDMAIFSLRTLTEPAPFNTAINIFARIISEPDFPRKAFNREKNQQLMAIKQTKESPNDVANTTFFQALYQQHPYAHPIIGTEKTVQAIALEEVKSFYKQFFVSSNAIVVLVGAINEHEARQIAEKLTGNLAKGKPAPSMPPAHPLEDSLNIEIPFPSKQTVLRLGQIGIDHHNPCYFPLLVGNYTLGGGMLVSQLAHEIREKRGLSYNVSSDFVPMPGLGPFIIGLSTKSQQANEAVELTRDTLNNFVKLGPTEDELSAAKSYLTGSFPLALASNHNIAAMLLKIAFYHLPDDFLNTYNSNINSVNQQNIKLAFQKTINTEKLLQVSVGNI